MLKKKNKKNRALFSKILDEMKKSWWFFLFIAGFYFFASTSFVKKDQAIEKLEHQVLHLEASKEAKSLENQLLHKHIKSHQDPQYVERTLIKKLGLVPKGHTKVRFKKQDDPFLHHDQGL